MAINKGYLTAKTDKASDEVYTPKYAIYPLIKYLNDIFYTVYDEDKPTIWCPFDTEDSNYVQIFREYGFKVIATHIDNGQNFFDYEPEEHYDFIISNPPFSIKDQILQRLAELKKPFAILMPLPALQGQKRFAALKELNDSKDKNLQLLIFDKRINFYKDKKTHEIQKGISFASVYLCYDFFIGSSFRGQDIIFEELDTSIEE